MLEYRRPCFLRSVSWVRQEARARFFFFLLSFDCGVENMCYIDAIVAPMFFQEFVRYGELVTFFFFSFY